MLPSVLLGASVSESLASSVCGHLGLWKVLHYTQLGVCPCAASAHSLAQVLHSKELGMRQSRSSESCRSALCRRTGEDLEKGWASLIGRGPQGVSLLPILLCLAQGAMPLF